MPASFKLIVIQGKLSFDPQEWRHTGLFREQKVDIDHSCLDVHVANFVLGHQMPIKVTAHWFPLQLSSNKLLKAKMTVCAAFDISKDLCLNPQIWDTLKLDQGILTPLDVM